jgi:hypothetical protein
VSGDLRPGLNPARLAALMSEAVARCRLDLQGAVVLTEAASGPYVVTPVLAAVAGATKVLPTRELPATAPEMAATSASRCES